MVRTMLTTPASGGEDTHRLGLLVQSGMRIKSQTLMAWMTRLYKLRFPVSSLNVNVMVGLGYFDSCGLVMVASILRMLLVQLNLQGGASTTTSLRQAQIVFSAAPPSLLLPRVFRTASGLDSSDDRTRRLFHGIALLSVWFGALEPTEVVFEGLARSHTYLHTLDPQEWVVLHARAFCLPPEALNFTIRLADRVKSFKVKRLLKAVWRWRTYSGLSLRPLAGPFQVVSGFRYHAQTRLMAVCLALRRYVIKRGPAEKPETMGLPHEVIKMVMNVSYQAVVGYCGGAMLTN